MGTQYLAGSEYLSQVELLAEIPHSTHPSEWDQQYF